jgi:lipopolysaccharide export LptBFGC system permease protein LptF
MQYRLTFARYFFIHFLKYLLTINLLFVFLFNFIEFFEKLLRVKHSSVYDILYFLTLNLAPSFFEQFPTSCWLATCLILREFYLQQEFDTLFLLSLSPRKLFKLLTCIGIGFILSSFTINEYFITPLTFKAEQYKMEHFKQISTQKLINKWIAVEQNIYCYFSLLNFQTKEGEDLFLIFMTPQFTIQKTISAPFFLVDSKQKNLSIPQGKLFDVEKNTQTRITNYIINNPSFFSQIKIHYEIPSIINLSKNLILSYNIIPAAVSNDLLGQLLKRILLYLLLIIYPLLTFGFFGLLWRYSMYRWIIIFTPYPIVIISSLFADLLLHHRFNAWFAYVPYYLIIIGLFIIYRHLK